VILHKLKGYYDRLSSHEDSPLPQPGWEYKEIPFIIVLDDNGGFVAIEDTREGDGQILRAKEFLVPQGVKKTSGIAANLLWDTVAYVFGVDQKGDPKRLVRQREAFLEKLRSELGDVKEVATLISFLENVTIDKLMEDPNWDEMVRSNPNLSFRFHTDPYLICRIPRVVEAIETSQRMAERWSKGICLVTGVETDIKKLHTAIKGVYGAQTSGGNIVSFNLDAFESYGKKQGLNAPVGASAEFAYTTALNYLLRRESKQRMSVGDATTVFWTEEDSSFEKDFAQFFSEPPKSDPSMGTEKIRALINSVDTGAYFDDPSDLEFNILGLSPNAARLSVRFWHTGTVGEFARNIRSYFDDFTIDRPSYEPPYYSLWRILVNLATQDKSENIPPNLAGDMMCSILTNTPYPTTLLNAALRRVQSDTTGRVTPVRAATIKAYLVRYSRFYGNQKKEVGEKMDVSQSSVGYHLGRLFAVLEKIQEEANPGLNATIRERYYGAACGTPVTVFANLLRLKNHHLAKLESKGRVVNFERMLGEIMLNFSDFPAHLDLHEQGRFAIGYYHQRQELFSKKEAVEEMQSRGEY